MKKVIRLIYDPTTETKEQFDARLAVADGPEPNRHGVAEHNRQAVAEHNRQAVAEHNRQAVAEHNRQAVAVAAPRKPPEA